MSIFTPSAPTNPFTEGGSIFRLVGAMPTTIAQQMGNNTNHFAGVVPANGGGAVANPTTVRGGFALWSGLTAGGLFVFDKKAVVVEQLFGIQCTPVWTIVDPAGAVIRATPTAPFKLAPNERLAVTTTGESIVSSLGAKVGCVVRLDIERVI